MKCKTLFRQAIIENHNSEERLGQEPKFKQCKYFKFRVRKKIGRFPSLEVSEASSATACVGVVIKIVIVV